MFDFISSFFINHNDMMTFFQKPCIKSFWGHLQSIRDFLFFLLDNFADDQVRPNVMLFENIVISPANKVFPRFIRPPIKLALGFQQHLFSPQCRITFWFLDLIDYSPAWRLIGCPEANPDIFGHLAMNPSSLKLHLASLQISIISFILDFLGWQ